MHADARERAGRTKRTHALHASACAARARAPFTPIAVLMHDRGSAGSTSRNDEEANQTAQRRVPPTPRGPPLRGGRGRRSSIVPPPPAGSVLSSRAETRENSVETVASERRSERELRLTAKVARQRRDGIRRPGAEIAGCGLRVAGNERLGRWKLQDIGVSLRRDPDRTRLPRGLTSDASPAHVHAKGPPRGPAVQLKDRRPEERYP